MNSLCLQQTLFKQKINHEHRSENWNHFHRIKKTITMGNNQVYG